MRDMARADVDASAIDARLAEAAETGETLEVILVLRGKVRRAGGVDRLRWRIRVDGRYVLTFPAGAVVAATLVARRRPARS